MRNENTSTENTSKARIKLRRYDFVVCLFVFFVFSKRFVGWGLHRRTQQRQQRMDKNRSSKIEKRSLGKRERETTGEDEYKRAKRERERGKAARNQGKI